MDFGDDRATLYAYLERSRVAIVDTWSSAMLLLRFSRGFQWESVRLPLSER